MARPLLENEDDRKLPFAVSLSRRQREVFKTIGGSTWLQAYLDDLMGPTAAQRATPKQRVQKQVPEAFCEQRSDGRWYILKSVPGGVVVLGEASGNTTPNFAWQMAAYALTRKEKRRA